MKAITFLKPNLVDIEMISDSRSKIVIQPLRKRFWPIRWGTHLEEFYYHQCQEVLSLRFPLKIFS